jgi:hypothetical protein
MDPTVEEFRWLYSNRLSVDGKFQFEFITNQTRDEKPLPPPPSLSWSDTLRTFHTRYTLHVNLYISIFLLLSLLLLILSITHNLHDPLSLVSRDFGYPGFPASGKGDGTYYSPSVGVGACEWLNGDDEMVAALNIQQFGTFARPSASPACGACIRVTGPKGTVMVRIVDKCPVCKKGDVDLSPAAFKMIADEVSGRVGITWKGC